MTGIVNSGSGFSRAPGFRGLRVFEGSGLPGASKEDNVSDRHSVVVRDLTKRFGKLAAVHDLSFEVNWGEFFGFLGPNGAGKTTTIKMLCGLMKPTCGSAEVAGIDVLADPLKVKAKIGILPEEINTYERLTGEELLTFSGLMHGLPEHEVRHRAEDLLDLLDLSGEEGRKLVIDYSMGMKKKIALACALIHSPEILFLDEPFNGVDAISSKAIQRVLTAMTEKGVTIFFSSHVLEVVEKLCNDIAIIHQGRLRARGSLDELRTQMAMGPEDSLSDVFIKICGAEGKEKRLDWIG
jgi:ABC-2 type transport system ATP-binding protein